MARVFAKLNLKDQTEIAVRDAPPSFEPELTALRNVVVHRKVADLKKLNFSLTFVTKQEELDTLAKAVAQKSEGDAVVWFAYPKGTSKKYKSELNREKGWSVLGKAGFEPVRQVAIDEDRSALRFRRVEFIKSMTRESKYAMTAQGKAKTTKR